MEKNHVEIPNMVKRPHRAKTTIKEKKISSVKPNDSKNEALKDQSSNNALNEVSKVQTQSQNQKKHKAHHKKYVIKNKNNQNKLPKENNDLKIYSLGGLGVVGMNMYLVEQNDEIVIMDAGILFADDNIHGVNYIIPDFTYLKENEHKIIGLFITHGHEDHIGAIPFLLQKVNVKSIYASGLAVGLIQNKMSEFPEVEYNITEFLDDSVYSFKHFEISFFRTNHSIPDSFGIAIKTNYGYVVNTGDFKFDFSPLGHMSDFYKMSRLGELGVVCLLSESTNADISQFSSSERKVGENLANLFKRIEGRIIVATFASNVYRVEQIIQSSIATGRKVIVFGHSMEKTIEVAMKLKYIEVPKGWVFKARDMKKIDTEHVTILCTGSQGEPLAALSRIASGTHKQIKLLPNDTIIYSSKPIPGNEQFINRNINKLVHAGANVIKNSPLTDTHTTGHASQNELRMMLAFMKPKYFVPVHGEYSMLKQHVEIAVNQGIKNENCFVLSSGDVLSINDLGAKVIKKGVPASDIYLDCSLSDVDSNVLKERKKMADEGLVAITYYVNKKKELLTKPIVNLKGFSTPLAEQSILNKIESKCIDIYTNTTKNKNYIPFNQLEKIISNQIYQMIYQQMDRKPLIVVAVKKGN